MLSNAELNVPKHLVQNLIAWDMKKLATKFIKSVLCAERIWISDKNPCTSTIVLYIQQNWNIHARNVTNAF